MNRRSFVGSLVALLALPKVWFEERPRFRLSMGKKWDMRAGDVMTNAGDWVACEGPFKKGELVVWKNGRLMAMRRKAR